MAPSHPEDLWCEAAGIALQHAVMSSGFSFNEDGWGGLRLDEFGIGTWGVAWVEGGRAVAYGYDLDYDDARHRLPPVDLLAGAPDWLPWDYLEAAQEEIQLVSWIYWWDGRAWARAEYPEGMDGGPHSLAEEAGED